MATRRCCGGGKRVTPRERAEAKQAEANRQVEVEARRAEAERITRKADRK